MKDNMEIKISKYQCSRCLEKINANDHYFELKSFYPEKGKISENETYDIATIEVCMDCAKKLNFKLDEFFNWHIKGEF